jgi:hypothetical protein
MDYNLFECPHCNGDIIIHNNDLNCGIFRHGFYVIDYQQIDPHLPEIECTRLFEQGLIYGCGRPFRIIMNNNNDLIIEACDYL